MSASEFEAYLTVARAQGVFAFRLGEIAVQFGPESTVASFGKELSTNPNEKTLGGWKRPADLDSDPDLDHTDWD